MVYARASGGLKRAWWTREGEREKRKEGGKEREGGRAGGRARLVEREWSAQVDHQKERWQPTKRRRKKSKKKETTKQRGSERRVLFMPFTNSYIYKCCLTSIRHTQKGPFLF